MDKLILTLDRHKKDPTVKISDRPSYRVRNAVRAVVTDSNGAVPLLYAGVRDYYKLPGGGIDEGEDRATALARELQEEIGSAAEVGQELGYIVEWKDSAKLKQISYCFVAKLVGKRGKPRFTEDEIAEGFEIVWANDIYHAIQLVAATSDSQDMHVSFMTTRDAAILQAAVHYLP